jgi:hypothetical protein
MSDAAAARRSNAVALKALIPRGMPVSCDANVARHEAAINIVRDPECI